MGKNLYIAEKPSVAQEFARVLGIQGRRNNGYLESADSVVTWCVGHLVTMSYPESYDPALKRWTMDSLPFLPEQFKYEVIDNVKQQFQIVERLLNREDVDTIYVCTDSGREGEYIYRLVEQMAGVKGKKRKRVWIDSQTEEEILRGIREAKDLEAYDHLAESAYLRAIEDYLMGINFSRALTLKFGPTLSSFLNTKWTVLSIGRVMTCVLGMVVRREREIRDFVKTPFYRILGTFSLEGHLLEGEWRAVPGSRYENSPLLYKENGFSKEEDALSCMDYLNQEPRKVVVESIEKKKENKNAPLLFNLAELQNECSKRFKISPDETLRMVQELYEKKLVTYPRTDARVLSTAVAKVIRQNISGLTRFAPVGAYAGEILDQNLYQNLTKSRYVNDKQITDHYAIIPTGQGLQQLERSTQLSKSIYELICRRFLSIFYPPAVYQKFSLNLRKDCVWQDKTFGEHFFANFRALESEGYLKVAGENTRGKSEEQDVKNDPALLERLRNLRKGAELPLEKLEIKEGETSPPKRYNSGSMILAMENAGQLIEDEELRAQIKGSGIGTSATRAEILKKLFHIEYLALNKKTQIITPTLLGELIFDVVEGSMKQMLNPELTASWEKGLSYVAEGTITPAEYRMKLDTFIRNRIAGAKSITNPQAIRSRFLQLEPYYRKTTRKSKKEEG